MRVHTIALLMGPALQAPVPDPLTPDAVAAIITAVATLAGLAVLVYRLGIWRQEMFNTKHNAGTEVSRLREETTKGFDGIHRRLDAIDRRLDDAAEQRVTRERWQARVDATLACHDRDVAGLTQRVDRLDGAARVEAA